VVEPETSGSNTVSRPVVRGRSIQLDDSDPLLGGVASGAAYRLGASPLVVRVAFAILGLAAGFGVIGYVVFWWIGIDRSAPSRSHTLRYDLGIVVLTAACLVVAFTLVPSLPPELLGPVAFVSFALAFSSGTSLGDDLRSGRAFGRIVVGLLLMLGGLVAGAATVGDLGRLWEVGAAIAAVTVGMGAVLAPWIRQLLEGASSDRVERIRAEERADLAAHLHDSVLQTLTLIQNRAHEPDVTSALAYQQERELRRWLYRLSPDDADEPQSGAQPIRTHLSEIAAGVEDDYSVVIDFVCVGDAVVDSAVLAMTAAVREALVNAAKFAKTQQISLYVEVDEQSVVAFVRDRGAGFDVNAIAPDRRGITDSIHARVERLGGAAAIRSTVGTGTEVRIEVPR